MSPDCISGYNHGAGSAYSLATKWPMVAAVSYTHLDVYKRQLLL